MIFQLMQFTYNLYFILLKTRNIWSGCYTLILLEPQHNVELYASVNNRSQKITFFYLS